MTRTSKNTEDSSAPTVAPAVIGYVTRRTIVAACLAAAGYTIERHARASGRVWIIAALPDDQLELGLNDRKTWPIVIPSA